MFGSRNISPNDENMCRAVTHRFPRPKHSWFARFNSIQFRVDPKFRIHWFRAREHGETKRMNSRQWHCVNSRCDAANRLATIGQMHWIIWPTLINRIQFTHCQHRRISNIKKPHKCHDVRVELPYNAHLKVIRCNWNARNGHWVNGHMHA